MALTQTVTKLDTYKKYLHEIGFVPSYQLDKCFSCGLPAVWLYMKSIGLEDTFFDILSNIKNKHLLFKELFYLLILTNGTNKFFPHVPENFLNIEIPSEVLDAQIEIQKPEFEMAYAFNHDQLNETLKQIVKPKKMVRIGDRCKSVAIMYCDDTYFVYHTNNPRPLEFKSLDRCIDVIFRLMNNMEQVFYVTVSGIDAKQKDTYPDALQLTNKFMSDTPLSKEAVQKTLQAYVLSGTNLDAIKLYIDHGADVNYNYTGHDKLLRMAYHNGNKAVINILLEKGAILISNSKVNEQGFFKDIDPAFAASDAFACAVKASRLGTTTTFLDPNTSNKKTF